MRTWVFLGLLALLCGLKSSSFVLANDLSPLQGEWEVISERADGITTNAGVGKTILISRDVLWLFSGKEGDDRRFPGNIKLQSTTNPKRIEWTNQGPHGRVWHWKGIYRLGSNPNDLTMCLVVSKNSNEDPFPNEFENRKYDGRILVKFRRVSKASDTVREKRPDGDKGG